MSHAHCYHPARAFRAWRACCGCGDARGDNLEREWEEKTHGWLDSGGPLLSDLDLKVIDFAMRPVDDLDRRLDAEDARDLAAYVRALDRKLAKAVR